MFEIGVVRTFLYPHRRCSAPVETKCGWTLRAVKNQNEQRAPNSEHQQHDAPATAGDDEVHGDELAETGASMTAGMAKVPLVYPNGADPGRTRLRRAIIARHRLHIERISESAGLRIGSSGPAGQEIGVARPAERPAEVPGTARR